MRWLLLLGVVGAAGAAASGCVAKLDIPTPPMQAETQAIEAVYEAPTGTVDIANVQATLDAVNAKLPDLDSDWLPDLVVDLLSGFAERLQQSGLPSNPDASTESHHFLVSAVVDLHRICQGWDDPAGPPDAANGKIDATGIVEAGRLGGEVWGTASACKTNLALLRPTLLGNSTLDGALIITLLGPLPTELSNARFLFQFNGTLGLGAQTTNSSIDFRVFDGRVAFRLPVSDGEIIVELGASSTVTLRGSNGSFACDLSSLSCQ